MKQIAALTILALAAITALAQNGTQPVTLVKAVPIQNLYAAGASGSPWAVPPVAGTALYAHILSNDTGTYAFTVWDALPNTYKPFTVTTNVGVGIAQKAFTIGNVPVYIPTSAGIEWTGKNTGWQYNFGATTMIRLSPTKDYYLMPTFRVLKGSVSGGSGLQPIVGLLFAWGK